MAFAEHAFPTIEPESKTMLYAPIGFASPLWALFAGAAISGAAWWWMTRWTHPENLEALFGNLEAAGASLTTEMPTAIAALVDAAETISEAAQAAAAPVIEAVIEASATAEAAAVEIEEAVTDSLVEAFQAANEEAAATIEAVTLEAIDPMIEPVGGESAPIAPAVEIAARVRRRPATPLD